MKRLQVIKLACAIVGLLPFLAASASGVPGARGDARPVINVAGELKMAAGENSAKTPAPAQPASPPEVILSIPTSFGDVVKIVNVEDNDGGIAKEARYKSSRVSVLDYDGYIGLEAMLRVGKLDLIILGAAAPKNAIGLSDSYIVLLVTAEQITAIGPDGFGTEDGTFDFQRIGDEVRFDLGYDSKRKKSAIYRDGKITVHLEALPPNATLPKDDCAEVLKSAAECTKIEAGCTDEGIEQHFAMADLRFFTLLENKPVFSTDKFYGVCRQFCTTKTYSVKAARLPLCGY